MTVFTVLKKIEVLKIGMMITLPEILARLHRMNGHVYYFLNTTALDNTNTHVEYLLKPKTKIS